MKHCLPNFILRSVLGVLLLAELGSCTLYRKAFHPYRLPTPKPSLEFKAKMKEDKARRKIKDREVGDFTRKKTGAPTNEAATDVSTPSGGTVTARTVATSELSTLPERSTVRYDKHLLMKKPRLNRRHVHKYGKPFRPWRSIRSFFKFGLHAKPNYSPDHRPVVPVPKSDAAPTPDAEPNPGAAPTGKP